MNFQVAPLALALHGWACRGGSLQELKALATGGGSGRDGVPRNRQPILLQILQATVAMEGLPAYQEEPCVESVGTSGEVQEKQEKDESQRPAAEDAGETRDQKWAADRQRKLAMMEERLRSQAAAKQQKQQDEATPGSGPPLAVMEESASPAVAETPSSANRAVVKGADGRETSGSGLVRTRSARESCLEAPVREMGFVDEDRPQKLPRRLESAVPAKAATAATATTSAPRMSALSAAPASFQSVESTGPQLASVGDISVVEGLEADIDAICGPDGEAAMEPARAGAMIVAPVVKTVTAQEEARRSLELARHATRRAAEDRARILRALQAAEDALRAAQEAESAALAQYQKFDGSLHGVGAEVLAATGGS
jgi:hypothetical protein